MDRLEALVATAHLRLRLRRLLMMIERNPKLLEVLMVVEIKRPIELAGLKGHLQRAHRLEKAVGETGRDYAAVLDQIDDAHQIAKNHLPHLRRQASELDAVIGSMIAAGDNGDPNDGETSSVESSGIGENQVTSNNTDAQ